MKFALSKTRALLNRILWPIGIGHLPIANVLLYEATPEREAIAEVGRKIYEQFPKARVTIDYSRNGGAMLNIVFGDNLIVLEYLSEEGYGVAVNPEPFTLGSENIFNNLADASDFLVKQLNNVTSKD